MGIVRLDSGSSESSASEAAAEETMAVIVEVKGSGSEHRGWRTAGV